MLTCGGPFENLSTLSSPLILCYSMFNPAKIVEIVSLASLLNNAMIISNYLSV